MANLENTLGAKTEKIRNVRSADTDESIADNHGINAWKKRKRGGRVDGAKPRERMDRKAHSDEAEDKALIKKLVNPDDLKKDAFARGGAVKGKKGTTVNVIIAPQGGAGGGAPPPGLGALPPPSGPMPPQKPPMMPAGPPAGLPPGAGPGGPPPGAGGPPMGRAEGGRVVKQGAYPIKDAAGGGEGRLEKIASYGANAKIGEAK